LLLLEELLLTLLVALEELLLEVDELLLLEVEVE
jgi:hypothetical protein